MARNTNKGARHVWKCSEQSCLWRCAGRFLFWRTGILRGLRLFGRLHEPEYDGKGNDSGSAKEGLEEKRREVEMQKVLGIQTETENRCHLFVTAAIVQIGAYRTMFGGRIFILEIIIFFC